jgi:uncharacterized membrane protein
MTDEQDTEAGLTIISAERLNFFSDAVVAIAITLLALELPVPDASGNVDFWRRFADHSDDYIAFLISFAVIGTHWQLHHRVFSHLARLGGRLARWNLLWLLMIVLTPFATKVIVGDNAFAARFTLYAGIQALAGIFFLLAVHDMDRHGLAREGTPHSLFARSYYRLSAFAALFLVSIPLAYLTRWAYLCWVAIPFLPRLRHLALRLRWWPWS